MNRALIIDGHNFLFKSFAVPFKFNSKKGTPLQVVSTFLGLIRKAVRITSDIQKLLVVFDSEQANTNNLLSADYKANRVYNYEDDSPFEHIPLIQQSLAISGIHFIEQPGYEADDIIASASRKYLHENVDEVFISSSDSDFYQLLDTQHKILRLLSKGVHQIYDQFWFETQFQIPVQEYVRLKSMVGDKADNIKGISGIGWKRGVEVIQGKRNLQLTDEDIARLELNRKLITLNCDVDIDLSKTSTAENLMKSTNNEIFEQCAF